MNMECLSIYLCILKFPSSMFNHFQCKSLTSLVKLAPKDFILFAANVIVFS